MADFTIVNVTDLEKATSIEGVTLPFVSADGTKLVVASVEDFTDKAAEAAMNKVQDAVTDMTTKTDAAVAQATSAAVSAMDAAVEANDTANHPVYIGTDNYVYQWDKESQQYVKTSIYCKGDQGVQGERGEAFTYDMFTEEQLAALKGEKGDTGDQGVQGDRGEKGDKGDKGEAPIIRNGTWWLYDNATGQYVNTGIAVSSDYELTKAAVEAVLQGNITTHTHDQYLQLSNIKTATSTEVKALTSSYNFETQSVNS